MAEDADMSSDIRELSEGGDAVPRLSPSSTISVDSDDVMEVNITKPTPSTVKRPRRKVSENLSFLPFLQVLFPGTNFQVNY